MRVSSLQLRMFPSLLCLLLLATSSVLSVPRQYSRQEKPVFLPQFSRLYNLNFLPPEDQVGDWTNPWTFSPTFPRVVPPSSDIMHNFGLTPAYQATEPSEARDLNRVAMIR